METRISYFDVIKTISIFLVIFVHYPWISNSSGSNISMLVTIIAVPLFSMVNGALLFSKDINIKSHIKKIFHLIINVICWKALILLICVLTSRVNIYDLPKSDIILYLFSSFNLKQVPAEHLWFMYSLIKIYLLFPFIYIAYKNNKDYLKYILIFCLIFSFGIELLNDLFRFLNYFFKVKQINFDLIASAYSPISGTMHYLSYFIIGFYLHNSFYNKKIKKSNIVMLIICYFVGLSLIFLSRYMQTGNIFNGSYFRVANDYLKIGDLIMCCSIFILFSQLKLKKFKVFNFIGSRTLTIYYVHMIILAYLYTYIYPTFSKYSGLKLNFIRTTIVLIIIIPIIELINKIPVVNKLLN